MSKQGKRDFRPNIHFTPEKNWNNDPNGLIYIDGIWHLYYQNNPNDVVWGPMHWGHAISKDLIHWEHLPVALYPDEIGTMYLVGNEILPNVAEAFRWYEKGAEMEEAASWYHLGICYAEGLGTEINRDKALEYLYRAYAAEYPGALEYITDNMQIRLQ